MAKPVKFARIVGLTLMAGLWMLALGHVLYGWSLVPIPWQWAINVVSVMTLIAAASLILAGMSEKR